MPTDASLFLEAGRRIVDAGEAPLRRGRRLGAAARDRQLPGLRERDEPAIAMGGLDNPPCCTCWPPQLRKAAAVHDDERHRPPGAARAEPVKVALATPAPHRGRTGPAASCPSSANLIAPACCTRRCRMMQQRDAWARAQRQVGHQAHRRRSAHTFYRAAPAVPDPGRLQSGPGAGSRSTPTAKRHHPQQGTCLFTADGVSAVLGNIAEKAHREDRRGRMNPSGSSPARRGSREPGRRGSRASSASRCRRATWW